jgi:hypothetical protein
MVKGQSSVPLIIFAAVILIIGVAALVNFQPKAPGTVTGGTVVSVLPIDYTNDPSVPFSKVWTANVILDGGGNYLMGASSSPTQAKSQDGQTVSKEKFTVNFKLNSLYCSYPLKADKNTLSGLAIKPYQPPNSNSIFGANPWSAACRIGAAANSFFSSQIYAQYQIGTDSYSNPVYCNALSTTVCEGDFQQLCQNQPGYRAVRCTIPSSKTDAVLQSIFGSNPYTGYSCVKVQDHDTATADYTVQAPSSKSVKISADIGVQKESGALETISLTDANNYQGNSADVWAKSSYTVNSYNPSCDEYSSIVYVKDRNGNDGVYAASDYTNLKSQYQAAIQTATTASTLDSIVNSVSSYNAQATFANKQFKYDYQHFSTGSGELRVDRSTNPPQFPALQLYINADWLGVVNPVAVPQLSSVSPNPISFSNGQQGVGTFTVTNRGSSGALSVALPVCTPSATFVWQADPNKNYAAGESYTASFKATADKGAYSCTINAQSSGYVTSGQYNKVSTSFNMNVAQQCTNPASPPRVRSPTADDPCRVVCPLDPAIAGTDICAQNSLVYNASSCACEAKPDCKVTNTCPVNSACTDGTAVGICNTAGQRCNMVNSIPVLQTDTNCGNVVTPPPACLPLLGCNPPFGMLAGIGIFLIGVVVYFYARNEDDDELKQYSAYFAAFGLAVIVGVFLYENLLATIGLVGIAVLGVVAFVGAALAVKYLLL